MKICLISTECYPFFYGGIGTAFYFLGKALSAKGHEVVLLTRKPFEWNEKTHNEYFDDDFNTKWVDYEEGKFSPHAKLDYSYQLATYFGEYYLSNPMDLVIYPEYDGEAFFLLKDRNEGKYKAVAFAVHYSGPLFSLFAAEGHTPSIYEQIVFETEKYCILSSAFAIAPSSFIYEKLSTEFGLKDQPHFILPNPVNPALFSPSPPLPVQEASGEKAILFTGRLQKTKGVDLLVRAFQDLVENKGMTAIRLQLIGKDVYWDEYQMNFSEYWKKHLSPATLEKIDFIGHISQNEMVDYLKKAWIAVFPSRFEVFGNVALEAINFGVPILVNRSTGLSEVAGPNYDIFWQGGEEPDSLTDQLSLILTDTALRNKLAVSSYERARQLQEEFPVSLDKLLDRVRSSAGSEWKGIFPVEKIFILLNQYAAHCLQEKNAAIDGVYEIKNKELDEAWVAHAVKDGELKRAWEEIDTKTRELTKLWADAETRDQQLKNTWAEVEQKNEELKKAWSEIGEKTRELTSLWAGADMKDQELKNVWQDIERKDNELRKTWEDVERKDQELKKVWEDIERKEQELKKAWEEDERKGQELQKAWGDSEKKDEELKKSWEMIEEKDRLITLFSQQQKDTEIQIRDLEQRLDNLQEQLQAIMVSGTYRLSQRLEKNGTIRSVLRLFKKK